MLLHLQVSAVFIGLFVLFCFLANIWPICSFVVPAWTQFSTCLTQILLDDKKYWFVVPSSELLFHMTFGYFGHIICCNGEVWAAKRLPGSRIVGMWLVWAVDEYHLIGDDPVFHFVSFRVKIRVSPAERMTVKVSHFDPSFPFRLFGVKMEYFGGGEYGTGILCLYLPICGFLQLGRCSSSD